ncbi:hypothetical protein ACNHUS_23215 [Actinomycetes bacterium M1A6_2h]
MAMTEADIDEVGQYLSAVTSFPAPPESVEPIEPGWYVQLPSADVTYGSEPWLRVSAVRVAYLAPALMIRLDWTDPRSETRQVVLVLDASGMNAEKCLIRIESFLDRDRWWVGAQQIGPVQVVLVPGPA